jgi:fructokinase
VLNFLTENGVSTSFIKPSAEFKTPVSLAFLDDKGNAQYSFYKHYPEDRLNITWPEAGRGDVVLFGSFYSLDQAIRSKIISFVKQAKQNGAIIIYDPNIRKNHLGEIRKLMHLVEENIALADIVRGSDEDFENLFGKNNNDDVFARIREAGSIALIITRNKEGVDLITSSIKLHADVPAIQPVSTIGAGDAFNAGIIYGLVGRGLTGSNLNLISGETWKELIGFGVTFATDVCQNYDNYISKELYGIA